MADARTLSSLSALPLLRASDLKRAPGPGSWTFDTLIGTLTEISEETPCGALSFSAEIVLQAQRAGEPVAWVAGAESIFFPADLAERGIDLCSVAVIRAGESIDSLRATEWLVRSGALGLVVVDAEGTWAVSDSALGRIQRLAELNRCAVLFLTRKRPQDPSLGSGISRRGFLTRGNVPFLVDVQTARDTRTHSHHRERRHFHGQPGMRQD